MPNTAEKQVGKDGRRRRRIAATGIRVERKMFTREEVDALVAALGAMADESAARGGQNDPWRYRRVQLLVRMAAATAARVGELLRLRGSDVEVAGASARIWLKRGKGSVPGHVWLANGLAVEVVARAAVVGRDGLLLSTQRGKSLRQDMLSREMAKAAARAGIDLGTRQTWHALRHHGAWREWLRTKDLRRVQALLGHRNQATTSRYLQLDERERDELVREATVGLEY